MEHFIYSLYAIQANYSHSFEVAYPTISPEWIQPDPTDVIDIKISDYLAQLAVLIPAHNEEKVIGRTLSILVEDINPANIYVVSDASKDKTEQIVRSYGVNLLENETNLGKTRSIKRLIKDYAILDKYSFMFILDADTIPHPVAFARMVKHFRDPQVACACGHVISEGKRNLFVAHRSVMYFIWQNIYKRISVPINGVTIAPGTASIYRTSVIRNIELNESLIIEDFDMTFQVHRKNLGKIVYEPAAKIVTQDPDNLRDYFKQVMRWQLGFVQTAMAHRVPFGLQPFDATIVLFSILDLVHSIFLLVIIPIMTWFYLLGGAEMAIGQTFVGSVLLRLFVGEIAIMWSFSLMQMTLTRDFSCFFYGPFLWLVQYVTIAANLKAYYLAFFRSVSGAWISPTRR